MSEMIETSVHIRDPKDLLKFIVEVDYLHDALLREAVLISPGYVDGQRQMWRDTDPPDMRMIFQSQSPDYAAVLLLFQRVTVFRYDPRLDLKLEGEFDGGELVLYLSGKPKADHCEIRAATAEYRICGQEFLGNQYRLVFPFS